MRKVFKGLLLIKKRLGINDTKSKIVKCQIWQIRLNKNIHREWYNISSNFVVSLNISWQGKESGPEMFANLLSGFWILVSCMRTNLWAVGSPPTRTNVRKNRTENWCIFFSLLASSSSSLIFFSGTYYLLLPPLGFNRRYISAFKISSTKSYSYKLPVGTNFPSTIPMAENSPLRCVL